MADSNTKNVKMGVCRVYWDGVDLGLTKGGVSVTVNTDTYEVTVDQYGTTPIKEYVTGRTITVSVPMAETTIDNLVKIMPGATLVTDSVEGSKKYVKIPSAAGLDLLNFAKPLVLHPVANAEADKSDDLTVFRAGTAGALDYQYSLDNERIFNCEFKGYPDAENENQLFAIGDTTATA